LIEKSGFHHSEYCIFDLTQLTGGKNLCTLLQPQLVPDPSSQQMKQDWPFWCYGYGLVGWLDQFDIDELLQRLMTWDKFFDKDPETEKGLELQPVTAYQTAIRVLTSAQQIKQGLFLAIAD